MPAAFFNLLWKAIDILEAQEHLAVIHAVMYPKLKRSAKLERNKRLHSMAFPKEIYKKDAKDVSFLLQKLGGGRANG